MKLAKHIPIGKSYAFTMLKAKMLVGYANALTAVVVILFMDSH